MIKSNGTFSIKLKINIVINRNIYIYIGYAENRVQNFEN